MKTQQKNIKWAPLIPLIGGLPIGTETAVGHPPCAILSYSDFIGNDSQYVNYIQNTKNLKNIEYLHLDNKDHQEKIKSLGEIDIIVGTPPCAALSMLNTSKDPEKAGSGCQKNKYMKWVFRDAIEKFNAKCIMVENAPALATTRGAGINEELKTLATSYGYSYSIYETSTLYHGIPQARKRTFAIMWKSEFAPLLEYFKKEYIKLPEFFTENESELINPKLIENDPFYNYIKDELGNPREILIEANIPSSLTYIVKNKLLNKTLQYCIDKNIEKWIRISNHAVEKYAAGLGVWDSSVKIHKDYYNAFISKNYTCVMHPTEERSLTISEGIQLMGMPSNFELVGGKKNVNMIAQNVPSCTAADLSSQLVKFILGELEFSNTKYVHQCNHKEKIKSGDDKEYSVSEAFY